MLEMAKMLRIGSQEPAIISLPAAKSSVDVPLADYESLPPNYLETLLRQLDRLEELAGARVGGLAALDHGGDPEVAEDVRKAVARGHRAVVGQPAHA